MSRFSAALRIAAWVLAFFAFLLVIAGGPALALSNGSLWLADFLNQTGRGTVAMIAGGMATFLAIGLWRVRAERILQRLAIASVGIACFQGFLNVGALAATHRMAALIFHDLFKQTFFCLMVSIAIIGSPGIDLEPYVSPDAKRIRRLSLLTIFFVLWQLIAGAILQNTGRGIYEHLAGAVLVAVHALLLARRVLMDVDQRPELRGLAMMLAGLVGIQFVLGYFSWREPFVAVITMHLANGALIYATSVLLALQSYRLMVPSLMAQTIP